VSDLFGSLFGTCENVLGRKADDPGENVLRETLDAMLDLYRSVVF
jgi:hypothetical protein